MNNNLMNIRLAVAIAALALLGCRRIFGGMQRGSVTWILLGVLLLALATLRFGVLFANIARTGSAAGASAVTGVSDGQTTMTPPPAHRRAGGPVPFYQDGWSGTYDDSKGVVLTLTVLPPQAPQAREMLALLGGGSRKAHTVALVTLRNRSPLPVRLDMARPVLYFDDGTQLFPPNPANVIAATAPDERQEQLGRFEPPFDVPPGADLTTGVFFLPEDRPLAAALDHIRLTLNGTSINIPGRPLSEAEKRRLTAPTGAGSTRRISAVSSFASP